MAVDQCDLNTLATQAACFACLSDKEKQALKVWFLAQAVNSAGGPDLTDPAALEEAVKCFTCGTVNLAALDVAVAQNLATAEGASVSLPIAELRSEIKCLACGDPRFLKAAETLLRCEINEQL